MFYLFRKAKTPKQLAHLCINPKRLNLWINFLRPFRGIRYKSDQSVHGVTEYFQPPTETLDRRSGDCEDFAWLAHDTLLEMADYYNPFLLAVYSASADRGHMVCFFAYKGKAYCISNDGMKYCGKMGIVDIKDLAASVFHDWKRAVLYEPKEGTLKAVKAIYPGVDL